MKTDSPVAKIQEFDILRALAILMLMFHHSEAYGLSLSGIPLEGLTPYFEGILLGIFFFISGYFAESSFQKQNKGSIPFFFCRMLRIYPPYLLGLFLYMFVLGISFKKRDLMIYLTGTHFIFAPNLRQTCHHDLVYRRHHFVLPYLRCAAGEFTHHKVFGHRLGS